MTRGSSPLTRGKRSITNILNRLLGLIPAHAGKTHQCGRWYQFAKAHPRSRGENGMVRRVSVTVSRLIPAHAGKTTTTAIARSCPRAHPRSRGENQYAAARDSLGRGSSPLTRGKRRRAPGVSHEHGLIPAHAGKTRKRRRAAWATAAHPRSRGENERGVFGDHDRDGSSPLTRGKRRVTGVLDVFHGLIPAHAGKTRAASPCPTSRPAHPRSRGENPFSS